MPFFTDRAASWKTASVSGLLIGMVLLGALLRFVWPADMEYKGDERYSFDRSQNVGVSEPWPWTGMNNSADVPHPGMSVWVFWILAKLVAARDPVTLNLACMSLNVLALVLLACFIARFVPLDEREPWWWGLALLCVNPMAVLFHRKIWPPSVLPLLAVGLTALWWRRPNRVAAFAFGLLAACAAQIHPGAFFFSAGLALWTIVFDRSKFCWRWALGGGFTGSIPAWPWACHLLFVAERSASAKAHWSKLLEMKFWVYWLTEPFGLNLQYSLGADFGEFLRSPWIGMQPTYLVAVLHVALVLAAVTVGYRYVGRAWRTGSWGLDRSATGLVIGGVGVGYGLLLTLTGLPVYRHYLIIAAPFACVALARVVLSCWTTAKARRFLGGLCLVQTGVSALFLMFVHGTDRPIRGDYGAPYRVQTRDSELAGQHASQVHLVE